ncbi:glycosyltransferase [Oscillatoria amoena NRMC-F 0135]|nr:glycosyltransferase [Oscillatoria amoena NRMC-F 0135]
MLERGHRVLIASDGEALALLRKEFPKVTSFELAGYRPLYAKGNSMAITLTRQLPKFYSAVQKEQKQVAQLITVEGIDAVISDNRYGACSEAVPCALVIHQLNLIMPKGFKVIGPFVNAIHRKLIKKFSRIWVPDTHDSMLSGRLSDGGGDKRIRYIGPQSRFRSMSNHSGRFDLVAVLSGPEPQRSVFEKILLDQLPMCGLKSLLVRGVLNSNQEVTHHGITVTDFLSSKELNEVIEYATVVVTRPGYSTLMDLVALGKKAILVPTPGQTEQEYLGELAMKKKYAQMVKQHDVRIISALEQLKDYSGFPVVEFKNTQLVNAINDLSP